MTRTILTGFFLPRLFDIFHVVDLRVTTNSPRKIIDRSRLAGYHIGSELAEIYLHHIVSVG